VISGIVQSNAPGNHPKLFLKSAFFLDVKKADRSIRMLTKQVYIGMLLERASLLARQSHQEKISGLAAALIAEKHTNKFCAASGTIETRLSPRPRRIRSLVDGRNDFLRLMK